MIQKITPNLLDRLEKVAATRRESIRSSKSDIVIPGDRWYVSAGGSDDADGMTPATAWRTLDRVNRAELSPGDCVLFHRGDLYRGVLNAKNGVIYSSYGHGPKPILCASPFDGAKTGKWLPTDVENIYVYSEKITDDIGCIVFDGGRSHAVKATVDFKNNINLTDGKPFASWRDLDGDLVFFHDLGGANLQGTEENSTLYLRSNRGAPPDRFFSMEFSVRTNGIRIMGDNVRINNLKVMYCGCHGIGAGTTSGLHVDWCEFEWIGGSVQFYRDGRPTRFGNAVEIYGGCTDYTVENCWINQAYDAGITHQFSAGESGACIMKDVTYKGNLIENCIYSIEYFLGKAADGSERRIEHVRITDNIMRFCGSGFGKQRPDKGPDVHIKSWDHINPGCDMVFRSNIFDRGAHDLLHIACEDAASMPEISRNVFIQQEGAGFARLGVIPTSSVRYTEEDITKSGLTDNVFYSVE